MNSKLKKGLLIGLPILLCLGIAVPVVIFILNKTVSISYQSSDVTKGTVSKESETVKIRKTAEGSTAIPVTGYSFVNWTKDGTEVSKEAKFVPEKIKHKNVEATYVANFTASKFNVTFVGNFEGSEYSFTLEETYGEKFVLPEEDPVNDPLFFAGWYTEAEEGEIVTEESIVQITEDTTLYAHWSTSCVAEGTLITMKDGSMKAVETIEIGDEIKTFDHETGLVSYSRVCFVWETLNTENAFTLNFENNVDVTVVEEHGFYDATIKKYAFINYKNVNEYIGHEFYNADTNSLLKLEGVNKVNKRVNAYAIVTANHLNHLSNGMLSMCDGIVVYVANIFEYDEDMTFNELDVENSIKAYGLFDKEEFLNKYHGWSSEEFDDYNLEYLSIAIGKGYLTIEELEEINEECIAYNESLL